MCQAKPSSTSVAKQPSSPTTMTLNKAYKAKGPARSKIAPNTSTRISEMKKRSVIAVVTVDVLLDSFFGKEIGTAAASPATHFSSLDLSWNDLSSLQQEVQ